MRDLGRLLFSPALIQRKSSQILSGQRKHLRCTRQYHFSFHINLKNLWNRAVSQIIYHRDSLFPNALGKRED